MIDIDEDNFISLSLPQIETFAAKLSKVLKLNTNEFKLTNVADKTFLQCKVNDKILTGTCHSVIVPARQTLSSVWSSQFRVMFIFQEKKLFHFMQEESQTARMYIATKQSTHPFIFVYTDLEQNFIIYNTETKEEVVYMNTYFLVNIDETLDFITSWLNVCSKKHNYDYEKDQEQIPDKYILPMKFIKNNF